MKKKYYIYFIIIFVVGIISFLPNGVKKTYANGMTLADKVKSLDKGYDWTIGASGVYNSGSSRYIYIGSNPDNYVWFNNDMYRIIGVFDEETHGVSKQYLVKLIRSRILGHYMWGAYNTNDTSGIYSSYKNDWTGNKKTTNGTDYRPPANLNILLNEYFYNKKDTSSTYGKCENWTYFKPNYRTNDCSDLVGYGLNDESRTYIQEVVWHLRGRNSNAYPRWNVYNCERKNGSSCMGAHDGRYSDTTNAKIGLMYLSDYLFASSNYLHNDTETAVGEGKFANNNWLYQGYEWTLTVGGDTNDYVVFGVRSEGIGVNFEANMALGVRPSFYLKSSVKVTGGTGTFDDPYTIACDDCKSN